MKTLYVSDLDGTLLRSDERTSDFTNNTINELVAKGMIFSYATARSYITAQKATKGLKAEIPMILYNGAFIRDNATGEFLIKNFFDNEVNNILDKLISCEIFPIVYAFINNEEKFSFIMDKCSEGMKEFLNTRSGDIRTNAVNSIEALYKGDIFYIVCIDDKDKLEPIYNQYKNKHHCVFQRDIYTKKQWLEILPLKASKANAIKQLKALLKCDRIVAFGDGKNDIDMFEIADEAYAVENAVDELKIVATAIIEANNQDGVAKWLQNNYQ